MLKNTFIAICFLLAGNFLQAQTAATTPEPIIEEVTQVAAYPGGATAIQDYVYKNQRRLQVSKSSVATTEVTMSFVVEKDGRLTSMRTISSPDVALEEEAVMLLKKMRWTPAEKDGQIVRSRTQVTLRLFLD